MCWPLLLPAQNEVTLSNLVVNSGTVTFDISWQFPTSPPAVWSDTVWVFIDHSVMGKMRRLPLSPGGTLTKTSVPGIGKLIEPKNNNQGVWVVGNAQHAGRFSASVQLFTPNTDALGACVYASNYPPVGKYNNPASISFTGTPMYNVVLRHTVSGSTVTVQSNSLFLVPANYIAVSFTDATGAPGVFGCKPMTGHLDFSVPDALSKNKIVAISVTDKPVAPEARIVYNLSAPGFDPAAQTGFNGLFSTVSPDVAGTYPVTVIARAPGYCGVTKTKDVTVNNCSEPVRRDLKVSASGFCAGSDGVEFSFDATDDGAQYRLYRDGVETGAPLNGTGRAASFPGKVSTAGKYTARVIDNGVYCEAQMRGAPEITENPVPTAPDISRPADVCQGAGDIVFTATNYTGTLVWTSNGGGAEDGDKVTFPGTATGTKTVTARSKLSYSGAPACYSATVTRSATIHEPPVISTHPQSQVFCNASINVTLTAKATPGSDKTLTYQWKEGAGAGTDTGNNNSTYTGTVSKKSDYWVVVTDNNKCTATSDKATITVSGYVGGQIGSGKVCKGGPGRIGFIR
jgi:hypothetical protein